MITDYAARENSGKPRFSPTVFVAVCCLMISMLALATASAENRALLVAIEDYPKPIKDLRGVREDPELMKEALTKAGIFESKQIKVLFDQEASKDNIVRAFKQWLVNGSTPGDTVLFYFSGHGAQIWDEDNDEVQDGKDEVLLCADAGFSGPRVRRTFRGRASSAFVADRTKNLLTDDEIRDLLGRLQGRKVIFISDSCHSGSVYKSVDPYFAVYKTLEQPVVFKSIFRRPRFVEPGSANVKEDNNIGSELKVNGIELVAFTASEDSQVAQIKPFAKAPTGWHSVLTWHLYHGILGKADGNGDKQVTFEELSVFLKDEMRNGRLAAIPGGFAQIPQSLFVPKQVGGRPLGSRATNGAVLEMPKGLRCSLKAENRAKTFVESFKSKLIELVPGLSFTQDAEKADCKIELGAEHGNYGALLSDATGDFWDLHVSKDWREIIPPVAGDLRAFRLQKALSVLRNPGRRGGLQLECSVRNETLPKQIVESGDEPVFKVKTKSDGYLYIFNVDTTGVIHPLYPGAEDKPTEIRAETTVTLGKAGEFVIGAPFGKETLYALTVPQPLKIVANSWKHSSIGKAPPAGFDAQHAFLQSLWDELVRDGKPVSEWHSQMLVLQSRKK